MDMNDSAKTEDCDDRQSTTGKSELLNISNFFKYFNFDIKDLN